MPQVFYDSGDINKVVAYYTGDTASPWAGMTKLADPLGSFTGVVDIRHHKIVGSTITEMTAGEKTARPLPAIIKDPGSIVVGTTAERDASTPFEGAFWCNTETGKVEYYNGSVWGDVGGGAAGGWETLLVQDVSAQATVDFTTLGHFDGTYKRLTLVLIGVNGTIDNTTLKLRFKVGGAWLATNYVYRGESWRGTQAETYTNNAGNAIDILGSSTFRMGTGANEKWDGAIELGDPSTTDQDRACTFELWGEGQDAGHGAINDGGGGVNDPGALEGIRFLASSGNLNGKFVLLGNKLA